MREFDEKNEIGDTFPDEHVLAASDDLIPWCANFANYLASDVVPSDFSFRQRKKFMNDVKKFFSDEPYLYRSCADGLIFRCMPEVEMLSILEACHSSHVDGHHSDIRTIYKIFQCGYYWQTIHQDANESSKACNRCQRDGGISRRQELPLNPILVIDEFDVWSIDFMFPFGSSHGMKYILLDVDYVSKLVEAIALANNEGRSVTAFFKKIILSRFGTPRAIIR
ncbi:uncharacterized protein [Solanum lycopersicum]|uniref:uncharacterized protein n=1 Tax=Solanum lycopersicum TaxID=4081 RepID=UPI003748E4D9